MATATATASATASEADEIARLRRKVEELRALKDSLASSQNSPVTLGSLVVDVLTELVDEMVVEVAFDFHRMVRLGLFCPCLASTPPHKYAKAAIRSVSVFD